MKMRMLLAAICALGFSAMGTAIAQPTGVALNANDTTVGILTTAMSADGKAEIGTFHIDHFEKRGLDLYVVGWFTGGPDEVLVAEKRYTYRKIADPGVVIGLPVEIGGAGCDSIAMTFGPIEVPSIHDKSFVRVKDPKKDPMWSQTVFDVSLAPDAVRSKADDVRGSFCNVASMINGGANRSALVDHLNMMIGVRDHMGAR